MKERISATVDRGTIEILKEFVKKKKYRNYSHVIEAAIESLKKASEEEKK